jgi:hypothetical protein
VLLLQVAFHMMATVSLRPDVWRRLPRVFRLAMMFDIMNLALLVGFWRWLRGGHSGVWQRTDRGITTAPADLRALDSSVRDPKAP